MPGPVAQAQAAILDTVDGWVADSKVKCAHRSLPLFVRDTMKQQAKHTCNRCGQKAKLDKVDEKLTIASCPKCNIGWFIGPCPPGCGL